MLLLPTTVLFLVAMGTRTALSFDLEQVVPRSIPTKWHNFGPNGTNTEKTLKEAEEITKLVANGDDTPIQDYPYLGVLLIDYEGYLFTLCGSVLISRKKVLTTAHCTYYMDDYDHYVAFGIYDLSLGLGNPGSQMIKVKKFKRHRRFSDVASDGFPNDIAMLTLESKVTYNTVVQKASLAKAKHDGAGLDCYVAGYGLDENFDQPNLLQSGYQVSLSNRACRKLWQVYPSSSINRRHICAMFYPVAACFGDSGGPLECGGRVVGLTSWGSGDCYGCVPVVFTRISRFRSWIKRH